MVSGRPQLRIICGVILALLGVLWIVQGLDLLGMDGGMNGERLWIVVGAVVAVAGAAIAMVGFRTLPRR